MDISHTGARSQLRPARHPTGTIPGGGPELAALVELARPTGAEELLDVAAGPGLTALAFAPRVRGVVAVDRSNRLLDRVRTVPNVTFSAAGPSELPFDDGRFDLVTCRDAARRFPDLDRAVAEMARVLRPGGRLMLVDTYAPEDATADRFINAVEQLHDPTHVRFWRLDELGDAVVAAGLSHWVAGQFEAHVDFDDWVAAARTSGENVAVLRGMLATAPLVCRSLFRISAGPPLRFVHLKAVAVGERRAAGGRR